jgi:hypothetical protein
MSAKATQADGESTTVEEGDLISDGPDNWTVHAVDGPLVPDDEVVVERYDGHREPAKRENIGRCDCGTLVFGEGPCYGCYKTGGE